MTDVDVSADELADAAGSAARLPTDAEAQTIASLTQAIADQEDSITHFEECLKRAKEALRNLTERDLPAKLTLLGISKFTLTNGTEVSLKPFSAVSILKGEEERALDWLRGHGGADIIKNTVAVEFGRGEDEDAATLAASLREQGMPVVQKVNVNYQTLNAWARVELAKGRGLDTQHFSVYAGQKAVIKVAKPRGDTQERG